MILPASFRTRYGALLPYLEFAATQIEGQVRGILRDVKTVSIHSRLKDPESVFLKLQRGEMSSLAEMEDLIGVKVVVLHPGDLARAYDALRDKMNVVKVVNVDAGKPEELRYRDPHIIVKLSTSVAGRHPEAADISGEIQITTYLQHALQESVHSVAYKGELFSWQRWRLAAQLRGMLELADNVLEQVAEVAQLKGDPTYPTFDDRNQIIRACRSLFKEYELPEDLRRMALIVEGALQASQMSLEELSAAFDTHRDLRDAVSLSPVDKVIGILLRERGIGFVDRLPRNSRRIVVSAELEDMCPEARQIPKGRRVQL